ncbi:MAG: DUF1015 domain-containing protein [Solirubrobacterales bacterium]
MAEIAPLKTLRYDTKRVGPLGGVISPPYDVIDDELRAQLAGGSEFNVVEIDLPVGEDKYNAAAERLEQWKSEGALVSEAEPAIWVLRQDYTGPDGAPRTRHGIFCRVRVTDYGPGKIRPHERTHPGPKQDRLDLMRATGANLSPIFSLFSDADGGFRAKLEEIAGSEPFDACDDLDGNSNTLWRVADEATVAELTTELADKELLIADGHHRYETARVYAEEIGGEGEHNYVLMFLCALEDPGMTVFATHRLAKDTTREQQEAIRDVIKESFEFSETTADQLAPPDDDDTSLCEFGYLDSFHKQPYRLKLKDQATAEAALADKPPAYRRLDTAILEALFLKGALGMTDDDISHLNGLGYSSNLAEARGLVESQKFDLCFFLRPTPIEQIREIAAEGENMPPKSTYFYPKIPTGLVFNPIS